MYNQMGNVHAREELQIVRLVLLGRLCTWGKVRTDVTRVGEGALSGTCHLGADRGAAVPRYVHRILFCKHVVHSSSE